MEVSMIGENPPGALVACALALAALLAAAAVTRASEPSPRDKGLGDTSAWSNVAL